MMRNIVDKFADRTRWGYLAAFIILLISYIVSFVSTQNLMKQSVLVNHSNEVIHGLDNVVGFVTQAESAARGYIISNRNQFLVKYQNNRKNTDSALTALHLLRADNAQQNKNLDSLGVLINDKFLWLEKNLALFNSTHALTPLISNSKDIGINKMTLVENFVSEIQNEERALWQQRNTRLTRYSYIIRIFTIVSLIVAILLTFYSIIVFNKENKAKLESDQKASKYRDQLETQVHELAVLNLELVELKNIEKFAVTGRISRTIAHEVRNPLTNINLAAEQLRNEVEDTDDTRLLFDMISRNSNRINQLISDLLNSTRVSELSFVNMSINDIIDSSLEFANDRIELKQIKVTKNYDSKICPISVDQQKIKIAFLNIIVNAIEAMEDGGILRISTLHKNDRCIAEISDNGKGMNKEDLSRLFEPYFTTKEKGTGLGLTNTQNIILAHNANIKVDSEMGKGTSFVISFNFA
jgi:signal transduction histidine kinase